MVLTEVAILIAIGLAVSFVLSLGVTRFIASLLYGVKANDPTTLSVAAAVLALVAAIAGCACSPGFAPRSHGCSA
jgi:ABC-type antimicrobial peptide transport system permease subunit